MSNHEAESSSSQDYRIVTCKTWDDYIQSVRLNNLVDGNYIYRGHSDHNWLLSSEWERQYLKYQNIPVPGDLPNRLKEAILDAIDAGMFQKCACGMPGVSTDGLDREDWEILARHHGLRSRLLDWSQSPFVAAFFAFSDHLSEDKLFRTDIFNFPDPPVAVWRLLVSPKLENSNKKFAYITKRREGFHRQRAQRGVFTRLNDENAYDLASHLSSVGQSGLLTKFEIPFSQITIAISDLAAMGISYATLFPDLDGAAKQVKLDWWLQLAIQIDEEKRKPELTESPDPPSP